jgi:hypothetical protein
MKLEELTTESLLDYLDHKCPICSTQIKKDKARSNIHHLCNNECFLLFDLNGLIRFEVRYDKLCIEYRHMRKPFGTISIYEKYDNYESAFINVISFNDIENLLFKRSPDKINKLIKMFNLLK